MAAPWKRDCHRVYSIPDPVHHGHELHHQGRRKGNQRPALRGYMDDLTITTSSHVQARWVLAKLKEMATWARMTFKPKKSRSLIIMKGNITFKYNLAIQGEIIPSIKDNPIKYLGKWYDESLKDHSNVRTTEKQAELWLKKIETSGLPGKFKAWLYQHGLLPRLIWLLTLYDVPLTTVEGVECKVNTHLRKWLGIPPSFTSVGLYITSGQLQLPLSSLVEEFQVAKCRVAMTFRESRDRKISVAGIRTRSGRKWDATASLALAEWNLKLKDIIGAPCVGRPGLGMSHFHMWGKANSVERRAMIQAEVRDLEEK